ncbi:MAG TPA: biotin-dependent carboxyltransferase family protein [Cyclobacteriaceae bacterium]
MSIEVIKAGIADSFQDGGRYGHQHLGINPNGAMDLIAMKTANALVGNDLSEAVLELCFPASTFSFKQSGLIALSGANFAAEINGIPAPINQIIAVAAGSELKLRKVEQGVFCYLAVHGGFKLEPWMGSFSTHVKAKAGGWKGRPLQKDDVIEFKKTINQSEFKIFPGRVNVYDFYSEPEIIRVLKGNEFDLLDEKSKERIRESEFKMTSVRDRMGYRLQGESLSREISTELISTAATFGTVQLLPEGQLIILMADHQTTGGYPRVAQVIAGDRSKLVQSKVGNRIYFREVSIEEAEELLLSHEKILKQIQVTCAVRLKEIIK